ncbi:MAG: hypothetical protein WD231_00735 [Candidatus Woykebacteria bacterium]
MFDIKFLNIEKIREELLLLELLEEEQVELFGDIAQAFNQKMINVIFDELIEEERKQFLEKFQSGNIGEVIEFIRVYPGLEEKIQGEAQNFEDEMILEIKKVAVQNL